MAGGELPVGVIIGITIGATIGFVLLALVCCLLGRLVLRARRRHAARRAIDLEQPLDFMMSGTVGNGHLETIKESELVTSPNIVIAQLDDADKLAMNGLKVTQTESPTAAAEAARAAHMDRAVSADPRLQHTGSGNSIMRWLESAELAAPRPGGLNHSSSAVVERAAAKLNSGLRSLTGRANGADLADMKRRLLAAGMGGSFVGDSSAAPLDVKGIVFSRLPPSRKASPAPSTVDGSTLSRIRPRSSIHHPDGQAPGDMQAPEEQLAAAAERQMVLLPRTSAPGNIGPPTPNVPTASHGGITFARVDSLTRRNSFSRTLPAPRLLEVSEPAIGVAVSPEPSPQGAALPPLAPRRSGRTPGSASTLPRVGSTAATPSPGSGKMSYADAMVALERVVQPGTLPAGSPDVAAKGGGSGGGSPASPPLPVSVQPSDNGLRAPNLAAGLPPSRLAFQDPSP